MTKDSIKTWLKRSGRDRAWLADQLGVSKKTVDNWLSVQDIPEAKLALIQRLMADDAAAEARQKQLHEPTNQVFSVEVDHARFRRYNAAAAAKRQTMEQWTIETLDNAVENISTAAGGIQQQMHTPPIRETQATIAGTSIRLLEPDVDPTLVKAAGQISQALAELHGGALIHGNLSAEKISLNEQPAQYTTGGSHGDHDPVTHDARPLSKAAQEHHEP